MEITLTEREVSILRMVLCYAEANLGEINAVLAGLPADETPTTDDWIEFGGETHRPIDGSEVSALIGKVEG